MRERELAQGHLTAVDTAAITSEMSVLGRFLVTKKQSDIASFKTPDLRNVCAASRRILLMQRQREVKIRSVRQIGLDP
jgi:cytochrome c peroxidase